jgi:hypothetical protein
MKRIYEKIKDLIELQPYEEVQNFVTEPANVLAAYRFTNVTSELMVRWLDALAAMPSGSGATRALAGIRGVGKSHFLAAFGALAAIPELSSTITDTQVAASARGLAQKRSLIVSVQRGTKETLVDELRVAFATAFGNDETDWGFDPHEILSVAASRAGNTPLVILVDTAFGRPARVARDDGPMLSALAEATKNIRAFIGLALDDDIAGADGANVSLSGSYFIDWLDPEHLYQVTELHLFHKTKQAQSVLHDVYNYLREALPGFNWSEQRFNSVYPIHPVVMDITPAVRLYAPTFAFLPFSAVAFQRVSNRPAHSLVALDEVFDRIESELRKSEHSADVMIGYDKTLNGAIAETSVMQRLQAKLALKCLFILSLDGRGATAKELCAASLIYDEINPEAAVARIKEMLTSFTKAAPKDALRIIEEGGENRYCFNITASLGFDDRLAEAAQEVSDEKVVKIIRNLARLRFEDWLLSDTSSTGTSVDAVDFLINWRGMGRRGRIRWCSTEDEVEEFAKRKILDDVADELDWEIAFLAPKFERDFEIEAKKRSEWNSLFSVWQPASLTAEDIDVLKRLAALRTNPNAFIDYGEAPQVAERTYTSLAERIWSKIYIENGSFVTANTKRRISDEARSAITLSGALMIMLSPMLSLRYPLHPIFTEPLGGNEVTHLVAGLFGGGNQNAPSVQDLARLFAAPLGLVSLRGETYTLEAGENILRQPWVREIVKMADESNGEVVPLSDIYQKLRKEPYGLLREPQQLVLASLVAQRRIELITKTGERMGRRMLDHKFVWDEIVGAARSASLQFGAEELTSWARRLTENEKLGSIGDPSSRESVRAGLVDWVASWRKSRLIERFEALPEDAVVTRAWRLISLSAKRFDVAAEAIEAALVDVISLEEGLQRVSDTFNDSVEVFERCKGQLNELENYIVGLEPRERVRRYISVAEPTAIDEIENARFELMSLLEDANSAFDSESNKRFNLLWREFQLRYSQHYATSHAVTMNSAALKDEIDGILRSDDWREFEGLSELELVNQEHWNRATRLIEEARNARCDLNVRQVLTEMPTCTCSFRFARMKSLKELPNELRSVVQGGLVSYKRALSLLNAPIAIALDAVARTNPDMLIKAKAKSLAGAFARNTLPKRFTQIGIDILKLATERMSAPPPVRVEIPINDYGLLTREELRARLNQWIDDLPSEPALVEISRPNQNGAN